MKHNFKKGFFVIFIISMMFCLMQTAFSAETFRTTDNVNFRASPSTDAGIIKTLNTGANVDVLEHDPANWSKVAVSGALEGMGYTFLSAQVEMTPRNYINLTGPDDIKNMEKMLDIMEDSDDVQNVWHNAVL